MGGRPDFLDREPRPDQGNTVDRRVAPRSAEKHRQATLRIFGDAYAVGGLDLSELRERAGAAYLAYTRRVRLPAD